MSSAPKSPSNQANSSTAHHKQGIILAGLDQPSMIDELLQEYPPDPNGFSVPIYALDPDQSRADVLKDSDQSAAWGSRVQIFAGPSCLNDLRTTLGANLDRFLPRHIIATGQQMIPLAQQTAALLDGLAREQTKQTDTLHGALALRCDQRGDHYWSDRYTQINAGDQARVLIITTRFSTFIHHSAEDLAASFRSLGHDARTLIEPSNHTNITPLLCLQQIEDFDPDLIVVINYPRVMHRELFPEGYPHICWIQDAMPHLFRNMEHPPSPLDFIAGHIYPGAAGLKGYPNDACLQFPVPISETKFYNTPISAESRDRMSCDIAYVSHQSELPDDFDRGFTQQFDPQQKHALSECRASIESAMNNWHNDAQLENLRTAQRTLATALGHPPEGAVSDLLWNQYIHPLAERILRHETLHWAAEIANTHHLTFRIFGNGWHQHPTLNQYAAGPLPHGGALRECYQAATVHLHASMLGSGHQRVYECALSGGFPLVRRSWDETYYADWLDMARFMELGLPHDASLVKWKHPAYTIKNHPQLQAILNNRARLKRPPYGWDHEHFEHVYTQIQNDESLVYWDGPIIPEQLRFLDILGDPLDLTFSTRSDLEHRVLRAINEPDWRRTNSKGIATRASSTISMNRFAERLLTLVSDRLTSPTAANTLELSV